MARDKSDVDTIPTMNSAAIPMPSGRSTTMLKMV
jgi:hypothetical protein